MPLASTENQPKVIIEKEKPSIVAVDDKPEGTTIKEGRDTIEAVNIEPMTFAATENELEVKTMIHKDREKESLSLVQEKMKQKQNWFLGKSAR